MSCKRQTKRVLILTPLAVAFQFIDEARKIGIGDIGHSKDGTLSHKIVVCNYERLHLLNASDFVCVMLGRVINTQKLCWKDA